MSNYGHLPFCRLMFTCIKMTMILWSLQNPSVPLWCIENSAVDFVSIMNTETATKQATMFILMQLGVWCQIKCYNSSCWIQHGKKSYPQSWSAYSEVLFNLINIISFLKSACKSVHLPPWFFKKKKICIKT